MLVIGNFKKFSRMNISVTAEFNLLTGLYAAL